MTDPNKIFSRYQIFIVAMLAFIQFTVILDFMVIAPLGPLLMEIMEITPAQFGVVVSAYAFSAGASGLLAAGFADRFDRKRFLLFFYAGFILGTFLCGVATDHAFLLAARIITGLFGGVIASVSLAIVADLFPLAMRSRVMGYIQMAFAVSQVAGIPFGIHLANLYGWHAPFFFIVALGVAAGLAIMRWMHPVTSHMEAERRNVVEHFRATIAHRQYQRAFATTALLSLGGFMMMPFSTAFLVHNVGISMHDLPVIFVATGAATLVVLPVVGRLSERIGTMPTFFAGTAVAVAMLLVYTNLGVTPLWTVIAVNIALFAGILSRAVPAMATMTAVPELSDRGAFMSINSSLQQMAGGAASVFAGLVVTEGAGGMLERYDVLGVYCAGTMLLCGWFMVRVNAYVRSKHPAPGGASH
ncbi:MAG: MFS transporter [Bacteroidetes bacterium]|nr:MAG: MFS transporter [Bacteroidota bacterium]